MHFITYDGNNFNDFPDNQLSKIREMFLNTQCDTFSTTMFRAEELFAENVLVISSRQVRDTFVQWNVDCTRGVGTGPADPSIIRAICTL